MHYVVFAFLLWKAQMPFGFPPLAWCFVAITVFWSAHPLQKGAVKQPGKYRTYEQIDVPLEQEVDSVSLEFHLLYDIKEIFKLSNDAFWLKLDLFYFGPFFPWKSGFFSKGNPCIRTFLSSLIYYFLTLP